MKRADISLGDTLMVMEAQPTKTYSLSVLARLAVRCKVVGFPTGLVQVELTPEGDVPTWAKGHNLGPRSVVPGRLITVATHDALAAEWAARDAKFNAARAAEDDRRRAEQERRERQQAEDARQRAELLANAEAALTAAGHSMEGVTVHVMYGPGTGAHVGHVALTPAAVQRILGVTL